MDTHYLGRGRRPFNLETGRRAHLADADADRSFGWKVCLTPLGCKGTFTFMRNRVRELRGKARMTQSDLGAALGVSRQTINSIEAGRYLPSLPLALGMARLFGSGVEEIFEMEREDS